MARILAEDGNVIAADFRPGVELNISIKTDVLYFDEHIVLMRGQTLINGQPCAIPPVHIMGNRLTGEIVSFSNNPVMK